MNTFNEGNSESYEYPITELTYHFEVTSFGEVIDLDHFEEDELDETIDTVVSKYKGQGLDIVFYHTLSGNIVNETREN